MYCVVQTADAQPEPSPLRYDRNTEREDDFKQRERTTLKITFGNYNIFKF